MIIDTDRVRRHIQAALASLPLLACAPPATPDPEITQRSAPIAAEPMTALDTRETIPEAAPSRPVRVVAEPEDPRRRARELHHAELRKHPPRPVAGRPLRVNGRDVIACLRRVDATGEGRPLGLDLMPEARAEVAAQWMLDARHEHASITSFERAHAELTTHGAPAALLDGLRRAAADEAVHTSLCLAMAWRYGAPRLAPGPIDAPPARVGTLAELAADVFEEGAVNETFAATVAATGARRCEVADPKALLLQIADDEARHAALAWATLEWALRVDPDATAAVAARADALRPAARPSSRPPLDTLRSHGRLDGDDLERAYAAAWSELVEPLLADRLAA